MPSIKEFDSKIKSLKNTHKITKTMKMVSASKLRKAQEAQGKAKMYAQQITELISRISATIEPSCHPFLMARENPSKALILLYTSDKGLCGSFNHNTHKKVHHWLQEQKKAYEKIELSFCGKRGFMFFQKKENVRTHYENVTVRPQFSDAIKIGQDLSQAFVNREVDEVYLAYSHFFSPLSQESVFEKILPIDPVALCDEQELKKQVDYLFEPTLVELLKYLVPQYLYFKIYFALLENWAGEHGARMTAMDNATKNASEMIDKNTLLRNRARQTAITTELIEIVAGAEALK